MALRVEDPVPAVIDRWLAKYLGQLQRGDIDLAYVSSQLKGIVMAAARDDPTFYFAISEGDAIVFEDGTSPDGEDG